ncbi:MAG: hypothetical protein ACI8VT_003417 [Saprospiraceae bacterium]
MKNKKFEMNKYLTIVLLFLVLGMNAQNKDKNTWAEKIKDFKIEPVIGLQLWSTYTFGTEVYDAETGKYQAVDNRMDTHIRRTRLGVKGQPYPNLKFVFISSLDLVGKDILAGTEGGGNNGSSPSFRIWNAFIQWKVFTKNDGLHITTGYLPPQIGRESITAALRVTSMEKSWSQNYLRRQLVGTGPGRAVGINAGGLFLNKNKNVGVSYDAGIFNPVFESLGGNSTGGKSSVLVSGRIVFHFGEPEFEKYTISRKVNYFGKRKGLSIALAAAQQGETDLFLQNSVYGVDWLLNWGNLNLSGEWSILEREGEELLINTTTRRIDTKSNTGFVRLGYNLNLKNARVLEPVLVFAQFNGALKSTAQKDAAKLNAFAGQDQYLEASLNYYFNPNLRLSLAYTFRDGDLGEAAAGSAFSNYFFQGGVGAIKRGDWLGLGLVAIF